MFPYVVTFGISYLLCLFGERICKNKKMSKLCFLSAVLVVAVFAGVRDYTIGTDTISYTTFFFDFASSYSSYSDMLGHYGSVYEPGFVLWGYILSRFFDDSHIFLFFTALFIYGFTMKALLYYRKYCYISIAWLLFLNFTCTENLNIMRQYMAIALISWAFHYIPEKKYGRYVIFSFISITFHFSGAISLFILLMWMIVKRRDTIWTYLFIIVILIVGLLSINIISKFLLNFGFVGVKVANYLKGKSYTFQLNPFLIRVPFLFLVFIELSKFKKITKENLLKKNTSKNIIIDDKLLIKFCILMVILELIFAQMRGISVAFYRMVGFFSFFKFICYSRVVYINKGLAKLLSFSFLMLYMFIIFIYWAVILKSGLIYPYTSALLGIGV